MGLRLWRVVSSWAGGAAATFSNGVRPRPPGPSDLPALHNDFVI